TCGPCGTDDDCDGHDICVAGECAGPPPPLPPLECGGDDVSQPQAPLPPFIQSDEAPPEPTGGVIEDGVYVTSQVQIYRVDSLASVAGETIEFRSGTFSRNSTTYSSTSGLALTGAQTAGTFATTGTSL